MEEEKIVKAEVTLERILFPKYSKNVESGEFAIFNTRIVKPLENCEELETIKYKGNVCKLDYGTTYKMYGKVIDSHEIYGDTYEILYMSKCIDISSKDKQKEFLKNILNENLVEKLFDKYEDVLKLLEDRDVKSLMEIKGIGNQVALKMIDEYEEAKDYSSIYMELGQLGLTHTFIKKLVEFYNSPDTVIDVVRNNPYDLVRVDGVGFKKADDVACKVGIGQYDIRRIKGFLLHHLNEQGEAGKSYLTYQELMQSLYDTLGFVPEEVVNATAKLMVDNKDVVVIDNGNKIALRKFYELEENIMKELLRLQIGNVKIIETEENVDELDDSDLHKDYIPKSFNIDNWLEIVSDVEENQGFTFTDEQKDAIKMSLDNYVIGVTGGAGCVDCDTEFFNGYEWKKISNYSEEDEVLQYNENGTTSLVKPFRFIKQPKEYLWHFETKYGIDQCLSENHNCIIKSPKGKIKEEKFESIMKRQINFKFYDKFMTTFKYEKEGIDLNDNMIRLLVAASADATYNYNAESTWESYNKARFRLKKARKISRLINILKSLSLDYEIKNYKNDDHVNIYVSLPYRIKEFPKDWYNCSKHQFEIIADEVMYWDGDYVNKKRFNTTIKNNADFIQFVFSSLGKRATISINDRRGREKNNKYECKSIEYAVLISDKTDIGLCRDRRSNHVPTTFKRYKTKDGYEYCFTVPSHMLVLRRNNKIFITGNCGKTTTANGICSLYEDYSILACALSGKASVRITEATGLPACTIHRALQFMNGTFEYNRYNKLAVDIVLIDEATMINGTLFLSLLEAIPTGAKVIIMGDVQQLTPIGNCQVFADILDSEVLPVVRLTKPHRQALRSGIIPTSIKIANQELIFSNNFNGVEILGELQDMELDISDNKADKETLVGSIINHFQKEIEKYNDIMEVQVCVPMRIRGELSCYNLNTKIQALYNPKFAEGNDIEIFLEKKDEDVKKYIIRVGDKVLNTKNNYKCVNTEGETTPVFNGNIGIVKEISDDGYCTIDFIGIGEVVFTKKESKKLELAYACTVHKMQGSGFASTIVGIDSSSYIMNNSELLYTAITRAKKYCVLVGNSYAITKSIQTKEVKTKQTFLREFLLKNKNKLKDVA